MRFMPVSVLRVDARLKRSRKSKVESRKFWLLDEPDGAVTLLDPDPPERCAETRPAYAAARTRLEVGAVRLAFDAAVALPQLAVAEVDGLRAVRTFVDVRVHAAVVGADDERVGARDVE